MASANQYLLRLGPKSFRFARLEDDGRTERLIAEGALPEDFGLTAKDEQTLTAHQKAPEALLERALARSKLTGKAAAAPDDRSEWLAQDFADEAWLRLPEAVRKELEPLADGEALLRLYLELDGFAALLPWEILAVKEKAFATPALQGNWEIVRHRRNEIAPEPGAGNRALRALVIVGSQARASQERSSMHELGEVARAIETRFVTRVIAACEAIPERGRWRRIPERDRIRGVDQLRAVIEEGYDVVHFIGHAVTWSVTDARGASRLEIAVEGSALGIELPIAELRRSLALGATRVLVVQGCRTRERVAEAVLDPADGLRDPEHPEKGTIPLGAPEHVLTFGAMLHVDLCAAWASAFYGALAERATVGDAARRAREAMLDVELQDGPSSALAWVPLHYSRSRDPMPLVDPELAVLGRYLVHVREDCARLLGSAFPSLPQDLVKVHVPLRARGSAGALPEGKDLGFAELLEHRPRWVLGGEPGSGKTTTLRHHARELAGQRERVPVFVRLAEWIQREDAKRADPASLIAMALQGRGFAEDDEKLLIDVLGKRAARGDLDFLLDGLDEVPSGELPHVRNLAQNLGSAAHRFNRNRAVISTRRFAYRGRIHAEFFEEADLRPLDVAGRRELLEKWFRLHGASESSAQDEGARWARWFVDQAPRSKALRELSLNPLHLTRMAETIRLGGTPSTKRHELYQQMLDGVFRADHHELACEFAGREQAELLLAWLAFEMTRQEKEVLATARDAEQILATARDPELAAALRGEGWRGAAQFLERMADHGAVFGPQDRQGRRAWRFAHRNFQELLAAQWLKRVWDAAAEGAAADAVLEAARIRAVPVPETWSYGNVAVVLRSIVELLKSNGEEPTEARRMELWLGHVRRDGGPVDVAREDAERCFAYEREIGKVSDYWTEPIVLLAALVERPADLMRALLGRGLRELALRVLEKLDALALDDALRLHGEDLKGWAERSVLFENLSELLAETEYERALSDFAARLGAESERKELWFALAAFDAIGERGRLGAAAERAAAEVLARLPSPAASLLDESRYARIPGEGEPAPFRLGSPKEEPSRFADEGPLERVRVRAAFRMGRDPVALGEYRSFEPRHQQRFDARPDLPVVQVSWYEAELFCRWLRHHGLPARLPTEIEWEYAARAGSPSAWCFGDDEEQLAEYACFGQDPQSGAPRPTGLGRANRWGLRDMHGNVWEWCSDWFAPYPELEPGTEFEDRGGPAEGSARVLRGGGGPDRAADCRSAYRDGDVPAFAVGGDGFRVVLALVRSRARGPG